MISVVVTPFPELDPGMRGTEPGNVGSGPVRVVDLSSTPRPTNRYCNHEKWAMADKIESLERLSTLLKQGRIDQQEYDALKREVLNVAPTIPDSQSDQKSLHLSISEERVLDQRSGFWFLRHLLFAALVANAAYWGLEFSVGFDLATNGVLFWGPAGPDEWLSTAEALYPLLAIGTGLLFVSWSFWAHRHIRFLGRVGITHSDHETIWWWLVPGANLVMPYRVVYETIRGTVAPLDNEDWSNSQVPIQVHLWTASLLGGVLLVSVGSGMLNAALLPSDFRAALTVYLFGAGALAVAALLAAYLVVKTTDAQRYQLRLRLERTDRLTIKGDSYDASDTDPIPSIPAGDAGDQEGLSVEKGGTITIDSTTYTFLADRQCLLADGVGQYYVSGSLPDVEGGELSFTRDENRHSISVDLEDVNYRTFQGNIESTIDGNVLTGTARLVPELEVGLPEGEKSDPLEAEFRIEC